MSMLQNTLKQYIETAILAITMLFMSFSAMAQNNAYRIDDECYEYYVRAEANKNNPSSIQDIDAMRKLAIEKSDKKAETLSYVLKVQHYYEADDVADFENGIASLKEIALKTGYTQYYYYAYSIHINYLLNKNKLSKVSEVASQMHEDAENRKDDFGFWMTYKSLATIHTYRKDYTNARRCYMDALMYSTKVPNQSTTSIYLGLASLYDNPDSSLIYIKKGMDSIKTPTDSLLMYKALAFSYGAKGEYKSYIGYKSEFDSLYERYRTRKSSNDSLEFEFYDDLVNGNYSDALAVAEKISNEEESLRLQRHLALLRSDYKSAYECLEALLAYRDDIKSSIVMDDIIGVDAKFNNDRLRAINDDLIQNADAERIKQKNNFYTILFASIFVILFVIADFTLVYIKEKNDALEKEKLLSESLKASKEVADKAREAAIKANNMKTTFVQNMSHEIRTPLNAIVGFSQLICLPEGYISEEEKKQYGSYITSNSNLLMMLIDDILNISDVENGNYKLDIKSSYCNEMCLSAMNSVEYRVPSGVRMYFTTEVPDDLAIETDERRVRQVIINFLTNACKHTDSGEIHIHCSDSETPGMITFSVSDTGTGVPEDKAEKIFERFTKLDSFKQGAGLGLNICKIISEKLNGIIKLDTNYKNGARFVFAIPYSMPKSQNQLSLSCESLGNKIRIS